MKKGIAGLVVALGVLLAGQAMAGFGDGLGAWWMDGDLPAALPAIAGTALSAIDARTLDLEMPRAMDLNQVFEVLGEAGIRVRSMRTKSNRLEELFVRLTRSDDTPSATEEAA